MSPLNIFLIITLALLLTFAKSDLAANKEESLVNPTLTPTITSTSTPTPTPSISQPSYFSIPKIQVTAPVISVGTDAYGKMELPSDINTVGWFEPGFKPGEKGNAVIAGHLDAATGAGAIFYNLGLLEPRDELYITDVTGKVSTFIVTNKQIFPFDQVPMDEVFGSSDVKRLNLITCTGTWNAALHNYSHRMIIFSELKEN